MKFPTFDKQEDIPEAFRSSYVKGDDGKWTADDDVAKGLRDSQRKLIDEKKASDSELERLKAIFGTRKPEDVAKLLKDAESADEAAARKAGDFDKLLEKRVNETKAEYEKRIAELAPYKTKYEDRELEAAIRLAALPAGVDAKDLEEYVIPLVKGRRIRLDEKTGKPVVFDRDGDPTGLTVEKFFADTFKAEAAKFYNATGGSGGGAGGGKGSGSSAANGKVTVNDNAGFLANLDKIATGEVKAEVAAA